MIAIIGAVVSKILIVYQFVISGYSFGYCSDLQGSAVNLFLGGQKPWVVAANASTFVYVPRTSGQGIGMMRKRRMRRRKKKEDNDGVEHDGDGDDELEEEWWVIDSPDETWRLEPGGQFRASKCNPPGGHKENRSGRIVWRQDD